MKVFFYFPEKNVKSKKNIKFELDKKISYKAGVFVLEDKIIFDSLFFDSLSQLATFFVILHEIGHYFYYTEHKCDVLAFNMLLKFGYSQEQILTAVKETKLNIKRINKLKRYIKWINTTKLN